MMRMPSVPGSFPRVYMSLCSCMRSFIQPISIASLQVHCYYYSERYRHSTDTVPKFHCEARTQATVSEGLAQGPYVAKRGSVEPMILRTKSVDSSNASPTPH